jgi:hypothetical protein
MTLLELKQYVARNVDDKNYGYFTEADLTARINLAQKELQKRLISANEQYFSICVKTNTVISQKTYTLPSDFIQVIRLERVLSGSGDLINTVQLLPITPNQVNLYPSSLAQSGNPTNYYFQNRTLILVPTPNQVQEIHLHYSYIVADMVNDADEPDANIPENMHEYIGVLATRDCLFQDNREITPIELKLKAYEDLLKQIAVQRNADVTRMVTMTGYGGDW